MRARNHVWLAQAAIDILAADAQTIPLAELLRRHPREMWLGSSWLPDVCFGDVDTAHVCRSKYVTGEDALPRRISELFEAAVAHVGRDETPFGETQTALAFFILGHYLADANCPLHVDPRLGTEHDPGAIPSSLHHELEAAWETWFAETTAGALELRMDGDSPLSIIPATAMTRYAAETSATSGTRRAAKIIIERTRRLAISRIPAGCPDLDRLQRSLGPRGLEMLAAECFACAVADLAVSWRAAWLKTGSDAMASLEL